MGWFNNTESESETTKSGRRVHHTKSAVRRRRASTRRKWRNRVLAVGALGAAAYGYQNRDLIGQHYNRTRHALGQKYADVKGDLEDRIAPYRGLETRAQMKARQEQEMYNKSYKKVFDDSLNSTGDFLKNRAMPAVQEYGSKALGFAANKSAEYGKIAAEAGWDGLKKGAHWTATTGVPLALKKGNEAFQYLGNQAHENYKRIERDAAQRRLRKTARRSHRSYSDVEL